MRVNKCLLLLVIFAIGFLLAACSSDGPGTSQTENGDHKQPDPSSQNEISPLQLAEEVMNSPAEITVAYPFASEELYEGRFGEQIKKKFPQYTIHFLETSTNADNQLSQIIATNPAIDIMFSSYGSVFTNVFDLGLNTDISDLMKKYQYDINQFQPALVQLIQEVGEGEVFGLPWLTGGFVFLYNKDLFDLFGVYYPADGMTWDEVYDLARTMTRTQDGVNYFGITMQHDHLISRNQTGAAFFDRETHEALFTEEPIKRVVSNLVRFYDIPGNELHPSISAPNLFQKEQTAAMFIGTDGHIQLTANALTNWDIATFPSFADQPDVGFAPFPEFVVMTSLSKNRDAAFQLLTYVVSEEQQQWRASNLGFVPTLKDSEHIMENFGSTIPGLESKNRQAIIPKQYANLQVTPFYSIGYGETNTIVRNYVDGKDLNTALREASERANQKVQEKLAEQK